MILVISKNYSKNTNAKITAVCFACLSADFLISKAKESKPIARRLPDKSALQNLEYFSSQKPLKLKKNKNLKY